MEGQAEFQQTVAIPDDSPVVPKLTTLFGEHTFFLNREGLHIVEPPQSPAEEPECQVVKLASRNDAGHTSLAPQHPEVTEVVVVLESEDDA